MSETEILLVTHDETYEDRVRTAYRGALNGELRRLDFTEPLDEAEALLQELERQSLSVVALGPDMPTEAALSLARHLDRARPDVSVLLIADTDTTLLAEALDCGVRGVLPPGADHERIHESFERAYAASQRRHTTAQASAAHARRGRIVVVLSAKGGAGKTTVSTNLATSLVGAQSGRVAVVDFDLQFGDVSAALGLLPDHTVTDAARANGSLDAVALKVFLTQHDSGVFALCGPSDPTDCEEIKPQSARRMLDLLADEFAYVVVDTSAGITEHTLAALEVATDLVLVCSMDVASVRSMQKVVAALDQLHFTEPQRHLVLNRAGSDVGLEIKDIEAAIGLPVNVAVPSSRAVPLALNRGETVAVSDPSSPVARSFVGLAGRLTGQPVDTGNRRDSGGRRLFRRG